MATLFLKKNSSELNLEFNSIEERRKQYEDVFETPKMHWVFWCEKLSWSSQFSLAEASQAEVKLMRRNQNNHPLAIDYVTNGRQHNGRHRRGFSAM